MLVLHVTINLQPDKKAEATEILLEMQKPSEAEEGCLEYKFVSLLENPDIIMVVETWKNQAALDLHNTSAHMAVFRQKLPTVAAGPSVIKRFEATPIN